MAFQFLLWVGEKKKGDKMFGLVFLLSFEAVSR